MTVIHGPKRRRGAPRDTRHAQIAVDCECGTTLFALDQHELLQDLREHAALAHDVGLQREPTDMLLDAYRA